MRWAREQSSLERIPAPAESSPEPVPGSHEPPIPEPDPPDFLPHEVRPDDDDLNDMDFTPSSPGDQWDGDADVDMGGDSDEDMEIVF